MLQSVLPSHTSLLIPSQSHSISDCSAPVFHIEDVDVDLPNLTSQFGPPSPGDSDSGVSFSGSDDVSDRALEELYDVVYPSLFEQTILLI